MSVYNFCAFKVDVSILSAEIVPDVILLASRFFTVILLASSVRDVMLLAEHLGDF